MILDRESVTTWPEHVDRSPFYPNTVLIRRDGMDWAATLRRGLERLMQIKPAQRPTATRSPEP